MGIGSLHNRFPFGVVGIGKRGSFLNRLLVLGVSLDRLVVVKVCGVGGTLRVRDRTLRLLSSTRKLVRLRFGLVGSFLLGSE